MNTLEKILSDIAKHNQRIIDNTPKNEKIDFTKTKINWGTMVIPKEFWIDINKTYKTKSGKKVILHDIVMKNSVGKEVTYPVKGTIITSEEGKRDITEYAIWSLDGRANVVFPSDDDLVLA